MTPRHGRRSWLMALCLTLLLGGRALPTPAVSAATTLHVVDCGDSGANTLRGRIAAASAGDTIVFDQNCTIALASTLTLAQTVTIDGSGHTVILDGGCTGCDPGGTPSGGVSVFIVNSGITAHISNIKIQHGSASQCDPTSGDVCGGGIVNRGTLTVTNSILSGNRASSGTGTNTGDGYGGGMYNEDGMLTVTNSTISGNTAFYGGGIFNDGGTLTATNCIISGNGLGSVGGGVVNNDGTMTITNSTISGNITDSGGGGIVNVTGPLTITNSTIADNNAETGGGIINFEGTLTVTNSTFSGNAASAGPDDGAIYNIGAENGVSATVTNSTISDNVGGIRINSIRNGIVTLTNTIVANNGRDISLGRPGSFTGNNNLIGADPVGFFIDGMDGNKVGTFSKYLDPLLAALGNYGGPTQTTALLPGSPAIDAGDDAACAAALPNGAGGTDQRGISRSQGAHCDIGAIEARFTLTIAGGNSQSTKTATAFAAPLAVTLGCPDTPADKSSAPVTFSSPAGGASATITGSPATTDANGGASVTATANGTAGTYSVTARAPGAANVTFSLTNTLPPGIGSITPASGSTAGGETVTLTGSGFGTAANTQVLLDGSALTAANIVSVTGTQIVFRTPAHAAGSVSVLVNVNGTPLAGSATYTYGSVTTLPGGKPTGGAQGSPSMLPGPRPAGTTGQPSGAAPTPLPSSRP